MRDGPWLRQQNWFCSVDFVFFRKKDVIDADQLKWFGSALRLIRLTFQLNKTLNEKSFSWHWDGQSGPARHLICVHYIVTRRAGVSFSQSEVRIKTVDQWEAEANCGVNTPYCVASSLQFSWFISQARHIICPPSKSREKVSTKYIFFPLTLLCGFQNLNTNLVFSFSLHFDFGNFFLCCVLRGSNIQNEN